MTANQSMESLLSENEELRRRLSEAEETIDAIRHGEVDALVVEATEGEQVYTLKGANQTYRLLIETMNEGALTVSLEGTILYCNTRFSEMLNTSMERIMGGSIFELIKAPEEENFRKIWEQGTNGAAKGEAFLRLSDGGLLPALLSMRPLAFDGQHLVCVVATDLSDQKRTEEELRSYSAELEKARENLEESEARFREVLETGFEATYRRNLQQGQYDYMSPSITSLSGYTPEEMLSMSPEDLFSLVHPDDLERVKKGISKAERKAGENYVIEYRFRRKDGDYRWFSDQMAVTEDSEGKPLYLVGSVRDVTDRKLAEEALRAYAARLEALNQDLQDFAFIAAHDLQEPLRKIQTFSDRVMTGYASALDDAGQNYLKRLSSSADRMRKLIHEMRSYSKLTSDLPSYEKLDLKSVIEEAASDLEVKVEETGAIIQIEAFPPLEADPQLMRILFQNLLDNALKYRSDNAPVIRISSKKLDELLQITVEDNGIGFEEKYAKMIFKPFKRLYGRKEYEGTGMGLAICRKIAERHGGSISAKSTPGEGSTFTVALPLEKRLAIPSPWERDLRHRAEMAISEDQCKTVGISPEKVQRLSRELNVHRIELEMQNEELRRSQAELQDLRDRYYELFNKVPVGYVVLKPTGMITDINQTGAEMLGVKSNRLEVEIPLSRFVAPHHRERYYGHINALKKTGAKQGCNVEMVNLEGKPFRGLLTSVPEKDETGQIRSIRIAITDITHR